MNVGQLVAVVRSDYLDDRQGAGSSEGKVDDDQLIRWLAEAEAEACRRKDLIYDETNATDSSSTPLAEITLASGTRAYSFSKKITRIEAVWYVDGGGNQRKLTQVGRGDLDRKHPAWRVTTGQPFYFFVRGRDIYPLPFPSSMEDGHTLKLEVYRTPLNPVADLDDEFEIDEEWEEGLAYWAAHRTFMNLDEDLEDPQGQGFFYSKFEEVFGPPMPSAIRRNILEEPREFSTPVLGHNYAGNRYGDFLRWR